MPPKVRAGLSERSKAMLPDNGNIIDLDRNVIKDIIQIPNLQLINKYKIQNHY